MQIGTVEDLRRVRSNIYAENRKKIVDGEKIGRLYHL
jgi:hypothetical protein